MPCFDAKGQACPVESRLDFEGVTPDDVARPVFACRLVSSAFAFDGGIVAKTNTPFGPAGEGHGAQSISLISARSAMEMSSACSADEGRFKAAMMRKHRRWEAR